MKTFREMVDRIRWTPEDPADYVVGYHDRFMDALQEMPLPEFIIAEIPEHRARYLRRAEEIVWDRRKA